VVSGNVTTWQQQKNIWAAGATAAARRRQRHHRVRLGIWPAWLYNAWRKRIDIGAQRILVAISMRVAAFREMDAFGAAHFGRYGRWKFDWQTPRNLFPACESLAAHSYLYHAGTHRKTGLSCRLGICYLLFDLNTMSTRL